MKKNILFSFLLLVLAACATAEEPYPDYQKLRNEAAARCQALGHLPGSPEFYSCVGTQYTRLKEGQ